MRLPVSLLATLALSGALGFPAGDAGILGDSAVLLQVDNRSKPTDELVLKDYNIMCHTHCIPIQVREKPGKPRVAYNGPLANRTVWQKLLKLGKTEEFEREFNKSAEEFRTALAAAEGKSAQPPMPTNPLAMLTPQDITALMQEIVRGLQIMDHGLTKAVNIAWASINGTQRRCEVLRYMIGNLSVNGSDPEAREDVPESEINGLWDAWKADLEDLRVNASRMLDAMANMSLTMEDFFKHGIVSRFEDADTWVTSYREFGAPHFDEDARRAERENWDPLDRAIQVMNQAGLTKLGKINALQKAAMALGGQGSPGPLSMIDALFVEPMGFFNYGAIFWAEENGAEMEAITDIMSTPMAALFPSSLYRAITQLIDKIHMFAHIYAGHAFEHYRLSEALFNNSDVLFPRPPELGDDFNSTHSTASRLHNLGGLWLPLAASVFTMNVV